MIVVGYMTNVYNVYNVYNGQNYIENISDKYKQNREAAPLDTNYLAVTVIEIYIIIP